MVHLEGSVAFFSSSLMGHTHAAHLAINTSTLLEMGSNFRTFPSDTQARTKQSKLAGYSCMISECQNQCASVENVYAYATCCMCCRRASMGSGCIWLHFFLICILLGKLGLSFCTKNWYNGALGYALRWENWVQEIRCLE